MLVWGGDKQGLDDLYRSVAAYIIALRRGLYVNTVVGREVPVDVISTSLRFDNVLYEVKKIPIDIRTLVSGELLKAIVEDSTDAKRLQRRRKELEILRNNIDHYYIHVRYVQSGGTIFKLMQDEQDPDWYVLEVML